MPELSGLHLIGASYDHKSHSLQEDRNQSQELLNKLYRNLPELSELELSGYRVGFRTSTSDRMPIVCEIDSDVFVNVAQGSRGLVSCGISGEILAGLVNNEPLAVSNDVLSSVDLARLTKSF